ncbi:hypothetical protein M9Y10_009687 [Tritrichomonas musculus]|uniref:VPS9 domain-containing protein n=1 Tax=Tritrichomonas musculus TaxID=1915356 RepID=A0ABR2IP15_9EUKA
MEIDLETDPLGLAKVVQVSTRNNVDIISKCAVPKNIVSGFSQSHRRRKTISNMYRTSSIDNIQAFNSQFATLFQDSEDVPESPVSSKSSHLTPIAAKENHINDDKPHYPKINFRKLLNFKLKSNKDDLVSIYAALNAQMIKEKGDLDDLLEELSSHSNNVCEISDTLGKHRLYDIRFIRKNGIKANAFEEIAIERCNVMLDITRNNIHMIDDFQEYLKKMESTTKPFPKVNIDAFLNKCIKQYDPAVIKKYDRQLDILASQIKPLNSSKKGDSVSQFLSPESKSGRIVARFIKRVKEMSYSDFDVVLTAITPNQQLFGTIRTIMFDIAWQRQPFPFAEVSHLQFPKIFDLTPRSINPPYLQDQYLDTSYSSLNSTDWPFKFTYLDFFVLMCIRNPFSIANKFYQIIQNIANVIQDLAVTVGGKDEDSFEIDFDTLFAHLLVCIIACGCPAILDTLEYCSKFIDYATDAHQQFAMTHCAGIVQHIRSNSTETIRRRVKLNKSISIFTFSNP